MRACKCRSPRHARLILKWKVFCICFSKCLRASSQCTWRTEVLRVHDDNTGDVRRLSPFWVKHTRPQFLQNAHSSNTAALSKPESSKGQTNFLVKENHSSDAMAANPDPCSAQPIPGITCCVRCFEHESTMSGRNAQKQHLGEN